MQTTNEDMRAAGRAPLFAGASKRTLKRLFAHAVAYDFSAHSVLWRPGERANHLHVLISGLVGAMVRDRYRNDYVVEFFWPGEVLALPPVVLGRAYLLSAETLQDSRILMVPAQDVRACVRADGAFAASVIELLSEHRMRLVSHVKALKAQSPAERLAGLLLSLADRRKQGAAVVTLPCERRMIAAWLGVIPSSVSRTFRELERTCGIEGRSRQIRIPSLARLAERAGSSLAA